MVDIFLVLLLLVFTVMFIFCYLSCKSVVRSGFCFWLVVVKICCGCLASSGFGFRKMSSLLLLSLFFLLLLVLLLLLSLFCFFFGVGCC